MKRILAYCCLSLLLIACGSDDDGMGTSLSLLSISVNGVPLTDGLEGVQSEATFRLVFSKSVDPASFEAAFSIESDNGSVDLLDFTYTNATTAVEVEAQLGFEAEYELVVADRAIGKQGESLGSRLFRSFKTKADGVITDQPPCISIGPGCLRTLTVSDGTLNGTLSYYSSYPLEQENTRWERIRTAVISVHGQNRDADQYFSHALNPVRDLGIENEVVVISPYFKSPDDAGGSDLFWSNSSWREGARSGSAAKISSYAVMDRLLDLLSNTERFPVLENIIIAGHSSGATFSQTYAAANQKANELADQDIHYVVANSQYFYYPLDIRYNQVTMAFEAVSGCPAFNHWPMGYVNTPTYLDGVPENVIDQHIVNRSVLYLLGTDDTSTTGSLNTSDCEATLLGTNRFTRGMNIYELIQSEFPDNHSEVLTVEGVAHNASLMFRSDTFKDWLQNLHGE